ncbi:hypothetical protein JF634_05885 [Simonsiella muelleri]|uniref:Rod shape-determining protein MreB n=1 Tax=Simonsiella muelleri ATCC 29453 TaxID=641147 RepID=V9HKL3_9NEIS|nr:hypothetical protein [Simonsiella muelleri]AUX62280.1 hypothetical protein BWP33_11010 [Simonsiella muelleri ATCC 29453]EFG30520.1 hypothetical protein HMPREF9021_01487 [Simonsiella muelleri ATCC 29453]UBQ54998.1 hypothetical protein JF634_05885 [Simonsiella muelleri]
MNFRSTQAIPSNRFRLSPTILIALSDTTVTLTNVRTREQFTASAILAPNTQIRSDWEITAYRYSENLQPFAHPRTPVTNSHAAEMILRSALKDYGLSQFAPTIILRPQPRFLVDITDAELSTLREIALKVGAARVAMYLKPEFSERDWAYFENA